MGEVKVNIKWGKQTFNDVEIDLNEDVATFKVVIYSLTSVPVEK
jgi:ubiquitin carboxyl-terminal hydrolase 14